MVETGPAQFGNQQYGVLTKADLLRLAGWTVGFGKANNHEGLAIRTLVRKLIPMMSPVDILVLAELVDVTEDNSQWRRFAQELREFANKPLFKQ